jgi:hypothetical protein
MHQNNCPVFLAIIALGNHPTELDGYFEIAEVIFETLLNLSAAPLATNLIDQYSGEP